MDLMRLFQEEASQSIPILEIELIVVVMLVVAAGVAIFARRVRKIPYTVALVIVGFLVASVDIFSIDIGGGIGELLLFVLVPPLIFEATLHINWKDLRQDLLPILSLAIFGLLLGAFLVGLFAHKVMGLSLVGSAAFGILISATDPVAVISVFRSLGINKRLALLVEGESLFNDGIAIVLFLAILALGEEGVEAFSITTTLLDFVWVAGGGLIIGTVLSFGVSGVILQSVDDYLIETASTVALAFGAFIVAESLHVSGILAVVAAGLVAGNYGRQKTSATTNIVLTSFWEFLAFIANSFVFLIIGLIAKGNGLKDNFWWIVATVLVVVASRFVVVYGFSGIINLLQKRIKIYNPVPTVYQHIMWWGGLRGAVSLVLALDLVSHESSTENELILALTFGIVLFTLLVQATTLSTILKRLGLVYVPEQKRLQQLKQGALIARRAGKEAVRKLHEEGAIAPDVWQAIEAIYDEDIQTSSEDLLNHLNDYAELTIDMVIQARFEALKGERAAVSQAVKRGLISEEIQKELITELDNRYVGLEKFREIQWSRMATQDGDEQPVTTMSITETEEVTE